MVALREHSPRFTPEEYFIWEEQQKCKYEYIDGEVYAMTGGSLNHSEIATNFCAILKTHLRGSGCRVLNSDAKVNIHQSNDYVYPDLSVTCDERDRSTTKFISYPCLVVEVLSPSTEAYDRGNKFKLYRQSSSLREYILISTDEIAIDLYRKNDRGEWQIINYVAGESIELQSVNLTFEVDQVFEDITFNDDE